jgi:hypothetical protein
MKKLISGLAAFLIIFAQFSFIGAPVAQAAVSNWFKGSTIVPQSQTDFGSSSFQQSLQNLKATGANYVALIVPYYQSNLNSTDIGAGWNTPTDASLASAIDYAHSIGMGVVVKMHNESYSGDWRAYINPSDRNTWYANFNNELVHTATLAQAHHAEMFVMGTEMVSTASNFVNGDNTERWVTLIGNVRKVYTGKLVYDANSTSNNSNAFQDEKESIGFWNLLDYAGLSVYYPLNSDNSVASLEGQWDFWNNNDLKGFQQRVGKQLLFSEVGYRSADNAHYTPWVSSGGNYNATEQVNDYDALLGYWNSFPYVAGILWWNWSSDPNAGGNGNTDYTVQGKPALQTMTKWFTTPTSPGTPPPSTSPAAISSTASANPSSPQQSANVAITANVTNTGGTLSNGIVDVEVYNQAGSKVFQQFFSGVTINSGQTSSFTANWTAGSAGAYKVAVGIFNSDWTQNYSWNGNATAINVQTTTTQPPPPPPSNPPPTTNAVTDIWWPTSGTAVNGVQPFKAMVEGLDISQYNMFWQVDGGVLNQMGNSTTDYPHKEVLVDLSGWHWQSTNRYVLNFVSKDSGGNIISQKSETITVQ